SRSAPMAAARLALVTLTVALTAAAGGRAVADDDSPLDRARRAAETWTYAGEVDVHWVDQHGDTQALSFPVSAGNGVIKLGGDAPSRLAATEGERWVFDHGQWDLVSTADLIGKVPAPSRKYRF